MFLPHVTTIPVLAPFSWLYGMVIRLRNWMYDSGKLTSTSFDDRVAVICVGNLAAGGTGKTPHTEYLVRLLQRNGIGPIAVLSRGYKRQSKGFVLAASGVSASKLGDESYQLFRKFPDIIVAVDEKRPHGIKQLLKLPTPPKVILLDDAFQHRSVKAGLNICLTSYTRILYNDSLLPCGLLREPVKGIRRADLVVVSKCPGALREEENTEIHAKMPTRIEQPILYSAYKYASLINLATETPVELDHTTEVLIVAGIADPTVMQHYVQAHYRLLDMLRFSDHHKFSNKDIFVIRKRLDSVNAQGFCTNNSKSRAVIITTEKDAARLIDHPAVDEEFRKRIYYLPTEVYFLQDHASRFEKQILEFVNKPRNNGNQ